MSVSKSKGLTPSEQLLAELGEKTFLRLWSYPNLYGEPGHELCDLLVVCGDDVLIFSDKSCGFPSTGDAMLDWKRWFRKSINRSREQALGAERWIKLNPTEVYLDAACRQRLPIALPDITRRRAHRIVVALGAQQRCAGHTGGTGSLLQCPDLDGTDEMPFTLFGNTLCDPKKGVVHVLDDVTLKILLTEFDTITDLVSYLRKKEALLNDRRLAFAAGEENLLPIYISTTSPHGEHDFITDKRPTVAVGPKAWESFQKHPQYIGAKLSNKTSYLWDTIINMVGGEALNDGLSYVRKATLSEVEQALRFMSMEDRVRRRMLSDSFRDLLNRSADGEVKTRVMTPAPGDQRDVVYVFVLVPVRDGQDLKKYRSDRMAFMGSYAKVVALAHRDIPNVVAIATESETPHKGCSIDLAHIGPRIWTPEFIADCEEVTRISGFYYQKNLRTTYQRTQSHPHISEVDPARFVEP